jgi:HD-GYP domain-containing protein (c-di-GMP phosphodiesterase class II)
VAQARTKVFQLQEDYKRMEREQIRLQEEIKQLNDERQEFITKARKGRMPDEKFAPQVSALYDKELGVRRKLTTIERAKEEFTQLDLEEQVKKYVIELQTEMTKLINADPQTPEERHQVFLLKKRIVDSVLQDARVDENREIHIKLRTNFFVPED